MSIETLLCPADEAGVARAAALLRQGEIIALPTETVYGIAADARNGSAVKKIFAAKGRPQDNPLIVHIDDINMLPGLVSEFPERAQLLAAAFWPGPLTIIMPRGPEVADECCAGLDTVGIRMPSHPVVRQVIEASGCAFAAPLGQPFGQAQPHHRPGRLDRYAGPPAPDFGRRALRGGGGIHRRVGGRGKARPVPARLHHSGGPRAGAGGGSRTFPRHPRKTGRGRGGPQPRHEIQALRPKADITILDGTFEQFKAYVEAHAGQDPACLCFTGEGAKLAPFPCVEYGREGDGADQSKHIFRSLRALDEQGDRVVYARCPRKDGVSMAVYNRLIRAAAFRVVAL